jgi:hypothetical protein
MGFQNSCQAFPVPNRRLVRRLACGILAMALTGALASAGCLYDPKDRCGDRQIYQPDIDFCACADGYGLIDGVCQKCGEHEHGVRMSGCVCEEGYARASASEPCTKIDIGKFCATDEDCGGGKLSCHVVNSQDGYCTETGCATSSDCTVPIYQCNRDQTVTYCQRPPTGLLNPCASDADCAGFEADYCEVIDNKFCIVGNCAPNPAICQPDDVCCNIIAGGISVCIPASAVPNGNCPGGGTIVPRNVVDQ